ncbi:MAG: hypothetical protein AB9866_28550 [Syntrophobacteraceae bacterium]
MQKPDSYSELKIYLVALVALCSLSISGCATVSTEINNPGFISENQPMRELSVLVANDGSFEGMRIDELISKVSESLEGQVGIRLKVVEHTQITWDKRAPIPMLERLFEKTGNRDADLVIGFGSKSGAELVTSGLLGGWQAVIDDTYRRYIVMTRLDVHTLTHEVCHAFIPSHAHSGSGLMQAVTIEIVPGVPLYRSQYLSPQDRQEILKNKWRNFAEVQPVAPEERQHTLNLTALIPARCASLAVASILPFDCPKRDSREGGGRVMGDELLVAYSYYIHILATTS